MIVHLIQMFGASILTCLPASPSATPGHAPLAPGFWQLEPRVIHQPVYNDLLTDVIFQQDEEGGWRQRAGEVGGGRGQKEKGRERGNLQAS